MGHRESQACPERQVYQVFQVCQVDQVVLVVQANSSYRSFRQDPRAIVPLSR